MSNFKKNSLGEKYVKENYANVGMQPSDSNSV